MPNYIVSRGGKPKAIQAVESHGMLWQTQRHIPFIDPWRMTDFLLSQQKHIRDLLQKMPVRGPAEMIALAKRLATGQNLDEETEAKADLAQSFAQIGRLASDTFLRRCAVRVPSTLPMVYKLAMGLYEFNPGEVKELCNNPFQLREMGRNVLFNELHCAGLIDRVKWEKLPAETPDPPMDPFLVARRWYSIGKGNMEKAAEFFGGPEAFFVYAAKRAVWRQSTFRNELIELNRLPLPEAALEKSAATAWRARVEKQLTQPYSGKTDLLKLFARFADIDGVLKERKITIKSCPTDRLFAIAGFAEYPEELEQRFPLIAALCKERDYPARVFADAVQTMQHVSPEDYIPNIHIDGAVFGCPDHEVVKVQKPDPRILVVGNDVKSCGHIGGGKKKMPLVRAMVNRPEVGCYIVQNKKNGAVQGFMLPYFGEISAMGEYDLVFKTWDSDGGLIHQQRGAILQAVSDEVMRKVPLVRHAFLTKNPKEDMPFPVVCDEDGVTIPCMRDPSIDPEDGSLFCLIRKGKMASPMPAALLKHPDALAAYAL